MSWRKRPEFLVELNVLRAMIGLRLGGLDADLALGRSLVFLALAEPLSVRVKDPKDEMAAVFEQAARDLAGLVQRATLPAPELAQGLAAAMAADLSRWADWIELAGPGLSEAVAKAVLDGLPPAGRWNSNQRLTIIKWLADAAGDVEAYIAATSEADRATPTVGAKIASRLLAADRVDEAVAALKASDPRTASPRRFAWAATTVSALDANPDWEGVYIESLERAGDTDAAQTARWVSFERSLSPDRLRGILSRLADFEDVEAADKAFAHAARHPDALKALTFLMDWPALPEAARMIAARAEELTGPALRLEAWAGRLRARQPQAAKILLNAALKAAAREGASREALEALRIEADSI